MMACSGRDIQATYVNMLYSINIVHLLVVHRCSLMYEMHGKTHIKLFTENPVSGRLHSVSQLAVHSQFHASQQILVTVV